MQYEGGTNSFKFSCNFTNLRLKKKLSEGKEVPLKGSNLIKLLQEEITCFREENQAKSEIIRMLSEKQKISLCLHINTTDTAFPGK